MPAGKKVGGRKKGVPNKRTQEELNRVTKVLTILEKNLTKDLKAITAAQRITLYADLMEYTVPKLARTEHTGRVQNITYNVEVTKEEAKRINQMLENDY